ncbi:MAG: YfhO family protein [bacterium]|nr:YfhO family protein [bacterium]
MQNPQNGLRTLSASKKEYGLVILTLAAAIALFWWRIWTPFAADRMHFTDDILIKDFATRMGLFRLALSGHLPLWDPYQFGGWPGIANCEAGFFYPFNWLMAPFIGSTQSAYFAAQILVMFHLLIAGLGAYRYARLLGLSPWGAGMTAAAYTFCGFHCAHKKHTNMLFTLVWLPWALAVAERWARNPRWHDAWKGALILALAYLAGHPQASLYITLLVAGRMAYGAWNHAGETGERRLGAWLRRLAPIAAMFALAFSLTAVQWLPTIEMIKMGERAEAGQFSRSTEFSMPPYELMDAVLPEALRDWSQVEIFYWGVFPLLLAMASVMRGGFTPVDRFLLMAGVLAVGLSMGEYFFLYDISYVLIPGVAWVRAPSRWIYFASLPIAYFAGRAIDWMIREPSRMAEPEEWRLFYRAVAGLCGLALTALTLIVFITAGESLRAAAGGAAWITETPRRIFVSALWTALFGGAFFLMLRLTQTGKCSVKTFALLAIALTWIDLGTQYRGLDLAPGPGGYPSDPSLEALRELTWNYRTKVFLGGGGIRDVYHGAAQGFYELDGNSPLTPRLQLDLREDTALVNSDKPNIALLRLCGVGALLSDAMNLPLEFQRRTQRLYTLNTPPPNARELPDSLEVDPEAQRGVLSLQSFPYNEVALVAPDREDDDGPAPPGAVFPKPFLFASASAAAVKNGAFLIVDGENVFEEIEPDEDSKAGYYFAVANPATGEIEKTAYFNPMYGVTLPGYPEHARMISFIDSIPEGRLVFAAARDNASDSLMPEGMGALRAIGASIDVRTKFRLAHAIVGVKGAPVGSALEILSPTEALVVQTRNRVYIEGRVARPPQPEWIATGTFAREWQNFFESIADDRFTPWSFPAEIEQPTGAPAIAQPVSVFSSIEPTTSLDGGVRVGQASILIGGVEYSPNNVGYNLAVYDPVSREVTAQGSFDLMKDYAPESPPSYVHDPPAQNLAMRKFIEDAPGGSIVLGALRGEGTDLLLPETIDLLKENGSSFVYRGNPDDRKWLSHAFVFVKGTTKCVETFMQRADSIVFTRYPGGPALTHAEFTDNREIVIPSDPVEEVLKRAHDVSRETAPAPPLAWMMEHEGPNRLSASGVAEHGGLVMLSELFYPGWRAYVDGLPEPIQRVNYYFRGVEVGPGAHRIEMAYRPASFIVGLTITLIALIAAIVGGRWARAKPR